MNDDIFTLLQSRAGSFSKGQRLIAKYITEAYDKAAFMTTFQYLLQSTASLL